MSIRFRASLLGGFSIVLINGDTPVFGDEKTEYIVPNYFALTGLTELEKGNLARGSAKFNEIAGEIDDAVDSLNAAYDKLRSDPAVQEELNY